MGKQATASFITELPLQVNHQQEVVLLKRLDAGRQLYNACLGESMRRLNLVKQSKVYQQAKEIRKDDPSRKKLFKQAKEAYKYSEYALHSYATCISHSWIGDHLDANTAQKLRRFAGGRFPRRLCAATRAYLASEKVLLGRAKKVRFKGKNQLDSVEGKTNKQGIRWKNNKVVWLGLELQPIISDYDPVIQHGLSSRVKYVRLVRRVLSGKNYFYTQLVCEGVPFRKPKHKIGKGVVGLDLGPSTIAVVSDTEAQLKLFAA